MVKKKRNKRHGKNWERAAAPKKTKCQVGRKKVISFLHSAAFSWKMAAVAEKQEKKQTITDALLLFAHTI